MSQTSTLYLPNLPGFKPHEKKPGIKKKFFEKIGQFSIMKYEEPEDFQSTTGGLDSQSVLSIGVSSRGKTRAFTPLETADRSVLTFQSYFEETLDGSKPLIRKCIITFYVEDSTLQIVEKPTKNSGLLQGTVVKRSLLMKQDGSPYNVYDFQLGAELVIFGRRYRLVDCDHFTRSYITNLTQDEMRPGTAIPPESYEDILEEGAEDHKRQKNANSAYQAALLGVGVDNSGRAGFVTYGSMKLNFECIWDNTEMLYGDQLTFSLTYNLADDTIEIFSVAGYNTGRDETFSRLLKRAKLPKSIGTHILSGGDPVESVYYNWQELYLGMELPVFGRMLRIVDCDDRTRQFYESEGYPLGPSCRPGKLASIPIKKILPLKKDYSAIGAESSEPKKRNGESVQLTFRAKILSGGLDDVDREFIITYYCLDDTIQILEPPIRNSGFWGGTFLQRMRVRNSQGVPIQDTDFYIGCDLQILKHRFRLYEADRGTIKYMDINHYKFPRSDILGVLQKMRTSLHDDAVSGVLSKAFAAVQVKPGEFSKEGLEAVLTQYGLYDPADPGAQLNPALFSDHENYTILHKTALQNAQGKILYETLIRELVENTGTYH